MKRTVSLNQNRDFRWLYARGKSAVGVYLAVYMRKNRSGALRVGLTVGSKLGGAVSRNKVRRRMKEAYRLSEHLLLPGHDIVIVARVRAQEAKFEALRQELLRLFTKLGLLNKTGSIPSASASQMPRDVKPEFSGKTGSNANAAHAPRNARPEFSDKASSAPGANAARFPRDIPPPAAPSPSEKCRATP